MIQKNTFFFIFSILLLDIISFELFPPNWNWDWIYAILGAGFSLVLEIIFRNLRYHERSRKAIIIIITSIIFDCIFVSLAEELIFRNLLFRFFFIPDNFYWIWIIITSLIFTISHIDTIFPKKGQKRAFKPIKFLDLTISGVLIGTIFYLTNFSLSIAIFIHGTQNLIISIEELSFFRR